MIQRSKLGLNFFPRLFRRHVYLWDLLIVVMRDILQSRYLRRRVAHKQLARTSLRPILLYLISSDLPSFGRADNLCSLSEIALFSVVSTPSPALDRYSFLTSLSLSSYMT